MTKIRKYKNAIIFDCLVGIISEGIIVILACSFFSTYVAFKALLRGSENIINAFITSAISYVLWFYAALGYQFLLLGIISGALGWYFLKRKTVRYKSKGSGTDIGHDS